MKIVRDTREQQGFHFMAEAEVVDEALPAGDYTIKGLEEVIVIERKASTGELYHNLAKKVMKERFHKEMQKLDKIQFAYIVCEFPESNLYTFPQNSGIPKSKQKYMKITAKYFRKLIHEIENKYDVKFIYCNDRNEAEETTLSLLKAIWEKYGNLSE